MIPSDDVAVSVYPPVELPTSSCPYVGAVVIPVPPYNTPTDVVADTTPLLACRGPFRDERVRDAMNAFVVLELSATSDDIYAFVVVELFATRELMKEFVVVAFVVVLFVILSPVIVASVDENVSITPVDAFSNVV